MELFDTTNETRRVLKDPLYVAKTDSMYHQPVEYTAATTFGRLDYTKAGVRQRYMHRSIKTAGYPQLNQVQHTAFDITDLTNLDMNAITANDLGMGSEQEQTKIGTCLELTSQLNCKIAQLSSINFERCYTAGDSHSQAHMDVLTGKLTNKTC